MRKKQTEADEPLATDCPQSPQSSRSIYRSFFMDGRAKSFHKEQNGPTSNSVRFLSKIFLIFHILTVQQLLSQDYLNPIISNILQVFPNIQILYRTLQTLNVAIEVAIIQAIYMEVIRGRRMILFDWLNRKIVDSLELAINFNLILSVWMMLCNWYENIAIFIIAGLLDCFYAIYMQNYTLRKLNTYITSAIHNLIFKVACILAYATNTIFLKAGTLPYFVALQVVLSIILISWYFKAGRILHITRVARIQMTLFVSFYTSTVIIMVSQIIDESSIIQVESIARWAVVTICVFFGITSLERYFNLMMKEGNQFTKIKRLQLELIDLLEKSYSDPEAQSHLFGIMKYNLYCGSVAIETQKYDPILKQIVNLSDLHQQKESGLRFYINHLYQSQIESNSTDKTLQLEYSEFLVNQMNNVYGIMQRLETVAQKNINVFDKIQISRLQLLAVEENTKLNGEIYSGKLEVQHIINSEQCFLAIEKDVAEYVHVNMRVWQLFEEEQIDLSIVRDKMTTAFKLVDKINQSWKDISKYFSFQRHWKTTYLNFTLFIKNQKIKQKQFDEVSHFSQQLNQQDSNKLFFEDTNNKNNLLIPTIMFDSENFCIKTKLEMDELIIRDVSKHFEKNTSYTTEEIKGCKLSILLALQLKQKHGLMVKKWLQTGQITNEQSYKVTATSFIHKEGIEIPALKYYKAHYHVEEGLEFICLIKTNEKPGFQLQDSKFKSKSIKKIEEMQSKKEFLISDDLSKDIIFEVTEIKQDSNIFLKEDILQPSKKFKQIQRFKALTKLFTFIMLMSILVLSQITSTDTNNLMDYGNQYINFMNMYRFPMMLVTNYMKSFLNIGNQTKVAAQIATVTKNMQYYAAQPLTMRTLFDTTLTLHKTYGPFYNNSMVPSLNYSQIDLFYSILSSISSLSKLPVDHSAYEFQKFNSYLKPSYDNMMNSTKLRLHETFGQIFTSMEMKQIGFMIAQILVFLIFMVLMFHCLHTFINKMKNILHILTEFSHADVVEIANYWVSLNNNFQKIFNQLNSSSSSKYRRRHSRKQNSREIQQKSRATLNKRIKKVLDGKIRGRQQLKMRCIIIITMIIVIALSLVIQVQMITSITKFASFEMGGFYFLRYFPTGPIMGYGCIEKYYSQMYPQQIKFDPQRFADVMSSMYIFGQSSYIGSIVDDNSNYYNKQKNYFFGNPCRYNSNVIISAGMSVAKCETICNGTFKQGISAFLRYGQKIGEDYMRGRTNMTAAELQEYTQGVTVLSSYVLDSITTWASEFTSKISDQQQINAKISIVIAVIIILIHLIINQGIIGSKITQEYHFICQVYEYMVPEHILLKEKVLKQKFVLQGLISTE